MAEILIAAQERQGEEFLKNITKYSEKRKRNDNFTLACTPIRIRELLGKNKYDGMILQYQVGAVPFTVEEIATFRNYNEKMSMVIIVPDDLKGGSVLNNLLTENILGAVYAKEAFNSTLIGLVLEPRTRQQAKVYYGIIDTVVSKEEINDMPKFATPSADKMFKLKSYIINGDDKPLKERLDYVVLKVNMNDMKDVMKDVAEEAPEIVEEIRKMPAFVGYLPKEKQEEPKKKGGWLQRGLFGKKKKDEPEKKPELEKEEGQDPPAKEDSAKKEESVKKDTPEVRAVEKTDVNTVSPEPNKAAEKTDDKPKENIEKKKADSEKPVKNNDMFSNFFDMVDAGLETDNDDGTDTAAGNVLEKKDVGRQQENKPKETQGNKQESRSSFKENSNVVKKDDGRPSPNMGGNIPKNNARPDDNSERAKAEAERKRLLEEERIKRDEKIREEARKAEREKADREKAEKEKENAELRAKNERLAREAEEKLAQEKKAIEEKAALEKKALEEKLEAERKAKENAEKRAREDAEKKAREDAEKLAEAQREKDRLLKEQQERDAKLQKEHEAEQERLRKEQEERENQLRKEQQKREAQLKAEAEKAREDAEKAKAEAERKAKEEAARIEAEYAKKIEEERKAKEEALREAERREKEAEKRIQKAEANVKVVVQKQLVSRSVVGIFGLYKGFDSAPIAVQLAKTLSQYEPVTYIEVPRASEGVYIRLELARFVGPTFRSVPHMIQKGDADFSSVRNMCGEINWFVTNDSYGEVKYAYQGVAAMVNGTSDNIVLETGKTLEEARKEGLLNLCTKAIIVLDHEEEERYIPRIRDEVGSLENSGIEPYVISVSDKGNEVSSLSTDVLISPVKRTGKIDITELAIRNTEKSKLLGYFGLDHAPVLKRKKQAVKIEFMGTRDIAVFGAERGNGVTHTCIMLANAVRRDYKTAMIELNPTRHMESLANELGKTDTPGKMNLNGIDVYYNMTWQQFSAAHRAEYQIVVIDFGTYNNAFGKQKDGQSYRQLAESCAKKYLIFDASPWRLSVLDRLIPILDSDSDPNGQIEMLAPMTDKRDLKNYNLYERVGHREIHMLPNENMPTKFTQDGTSEIMRQLILSK